MSRNQVYHSCDCLNFLFVAAIFLKTDLMYMVKIGDTYTYTTDGLSIWDEFKQRMAAHLIIHMCIDIWANCPQIIPYRYLNQ